MELYKRANPLPGASAKVPLLEVVGQDDGEDNDTTSVVLCESLVVAEYIAELQAKLIEEGPSSMGLLLLPTKPEDRAIMRLFFELCSSCFTYFPILRSAGDETKLEAALDQFKMGLLNVDTFLRTMGNRGRDGPYLFGNQFTLAECNAAPFVQRACMVLPTGIGSGRSIDPLDICDEFKLDRVKCWIMAVLDRPSVSETAVPKEVYMKNVEEFLKKMDQQS